ncbi:MAG: glycosyltransferase family 1 protein, partial [Verrucomicrobiota bacterium]
MKICIDARWIKTQLSGVGVYTRELIRELSRLDTTNQYLCLFDSQEVLDRTREETGFDRNPNWSAERVDMKIFSLASQLKLPGWLKRNRVDVYHSPNWMIPFRAFPAGRRGRTACVVTVHDLIPLLFPDHAPRSRKRRFFPVYRALMRALGKRADMIVAPSQASADDIVEHLDVDRARVEVIHNGVSERYQPGGQPREPVILYVGRRDPYKNVPLLVEAFAGVREQLGEEARLELIGARDDRYPETDTAIARLGLAGQVVQRDYVSDAELLQAYQRARMLVLPSSYEGFGLPVVEAMACGTPVICSNASSLPEVAGEVGVLVEAGDAAVLAEAILSVWENPPDAGLLQAQAAR